MKCITYKPENGKQQVARVKDDLALDLVFRGYARYVCKAEWKSTGREYRSYLSTRSLEKVR